MGNAVGTAFQVTRLVTLMALDRLVESDTVHSKPCGEMRDLLAAAIATVGPKSGIGSYIKDALDILPKKLFDAIQAKKGFGNDFSSHECGIVERTVGGKKLRYVAVVLGSLNPQNTDPPGRQDLSDMVRRLDDVVIAIN
jgi:hypothetical protein